MTTETTDIELTAILDAMEAHACEHGHKLSYDAAKGAHKIAGCADTLTVAWTDGDDPGWAYWLRTHNAETGDLLREESGGLDSIAELRSILDEID